MLAVEWGAFVALTFDFKQRTQIYIWSARWTMTGIRTFCQQFMELFYHCAAADDDDVDDDMSWVFISHKALVGGIERERWTRTVDRSVG